MLFWCWFVSIIFTYFKFNLCSIIFLDQKITSIVIYATFKALFFYSVVFVVVVACVFKELLELCIDEPSGVIVIIASVWCEGAVQASVSCIGLCKLWRHQVTNGKVLLLFHVLLPLFFERFLIFGISGVILLDLVTDHGGLGGIAGLTID